MLPGPNKFSWGVEIVIHWKRIALPRQCYVFCCLHIAGECVRRRKEDLIHIFVSDRVPRTSVSLGTTAPSFGEWLESGLACFWVIPSRLGDPYPFDEVYGWGRLGEGSE